MIQLRIFILIFSIFPYFNLVHAANANQLIGANISSTGDTSHLELFGQNEWVYNLNKNQKDKKTIYSVVVNKLDAKSSENLKKFKSDLIKKIEIIDNAIDNKQEIKIEVANNSIEVFDYLTDQPYRLIFDFYINPDEAKLIKKSHNVKNDQNLKAQSKIESLAQDKNKAQTSNTSDRNIATADILKIENSGPQLSFNDSGKGLFDGADPNYERFSIKDYEIKPDSILKAKENYYLDFPIVNRLPDVFNQMMAAKPSYEFEKKTSEENKEIRLVHTLFQKKRYAVFLKTADWFQEKFPFSEYKESLSFMIADVYYQLSQEQNDSNMLEKAIDAYRMSIKKYPKSPLYERTSLLVGYLTLKKGDFLTAIRDFNTHIENNNIDNNSISKDYAQMAIGICLQNLFRYQEAIEAYSSLEKKSKNPQIKAEAASRIGDVQMTSKNYASAEQTYGDVAKKYPDTIIRLPSVTYNRAEADFRTDKFKDALDLFRTYLKNFPNDPESPLAMTRVGELLDILGADKSKSMGAFLETYFRYGDSPNGIVARLYLQSSKMKKMKPKEAESSVKDLIELADKSEIPNVKLFTSIRIADGYNERKEFNKSIDTLIQFYQKHPLSQEINQVQKRIVKNINDKIKNEIEHEKFLEALQTYSQYEKTWPKLNDRLDTKFFLGRAYELGGATKESEKYYKDVLNKIYATDNTKEGKILKLTQDLPSTDSVNLRLSAIDFSNNKWNQSYEYLRQIKSPEQLSEKEQIERVNIAANLLEKRGDYDTAIRYLTELVSTWKGQPALVAEPYFKLAELELKQNKPKDAISTYLKIDTLMQDSNLVSEGIHSKSLEKLADLYLEAKEINEATKYYNQLLNMYESKKPLASIRYKFGKIYFDRGEVQKASDVWSKLESTQQNEFWTKLANEQLTGAEWNKDYKKYKDRIPAMAERETEPANTNKKDEPKKGESK